MKYCRCCKKRYPDTHAYCIDDGTLLVKRKFHSVFFASANENRIIYSLIALMVLILITVNMLPMGVKWAASRCKVTVQGISVDGDKSILRNMSELIRVVKDTFSGEEIPYPRDGKVVLLLSVRNNLYFPLSLKSADMRLLVNGKTAARGGVSHNEPIIIDKMKETKLRMPLKISLPALAALILERKVDCRAQGRVLIDTIIGDIEIPINIDDFNIR